MHSKMSSTDSLSTSVSKLYKFPASSALSTPKTDNELTMDTSDLNILKDITKSGELLTKNKYAVQDYGCIQQLYSDTKYADLEIECIYGATLNKRFHKFVIASSSEVLKNKFYPKKFSSSSEDTLKSAYESKVLSPKSTLATLNARTPSFVHSVGPLQTETNYAFRSEIAYNEIEKTSIFNELSHRCADLLVKLLYRIAVDLNSISLSETLDMLEIAQKYKISRVNHYIFKYLNAIAVTKHNLEPLKKVCDTYSSDLILLAHNCQTFSAINSNIFNETNDTEPCFEQTIPQNIEVLRGENAEAIKYVKYGPISKKECTYHRIAVKNEKENRNYEIVLKISQPICINHILLRLFDDKLCSYSYYVEVSEDNQNWNRIADYRQYQCRSWQRLYFQSTKIQFVRIVGTDIHNTTDWQYFAMSSIQFFNLNSPLKTLNHILCPNEDMAEQSKGALLLRGVNNTESNFTYHNPYGFIIFQLPQVIIAANLSVKTWSNTKYEFKVWLSVDSKNWKQVFDNEGIVNQYNSDHIIEFESQPILFIKIKGENVDENNENDDTFRMVSLQCPHKHQ